jgi:hypothetical protein
MPQAIRPVQNSVLLTQAHLILLRAAEAVDGCDHGAAAGEKITYTAAYGNERAISYLFLPKKATVPLTSSRTVPHSCETSLRLTARPHNSIDQERTYSRLRNILLVQEKTSKCRENLSRCRLLRISRASLLMARVHDHR